MEPLPPNIPFGHSFRNRNGPIQTLTLAPLWFILTSKLTLFFHKRNILTCSMLHAAYLYPDSRTHGCGYNKSKNFSLQPSIVLVTMWIQSKSPPPISNQSLTNVIMDQVSGLLVVGIYWAATDNLE